MVAKRALLPGLNIWCLNLAKIHMVAKLMSQKEELQ